MKIWILIFTVFNKMFFLTNCSELKVVENIRNFNVHKVAILVVKLVMNVNRFHSFVVVMVQLLLHRCVIPLYYYYCHTIISYKNIRFGVYRIQSSQFFLEKLLFYSLCLIHGFFSPQFSLIHLILYY